MGRGGKRREKREKRGRKEKEGKEKGGGGRPREKGRREEEKGKKRQRSRPLLASPRQRHGAGAIRAHAIHVGNAAALISERHGTEHPRGVLYAHTSAALLRAKIRLGREKGRGRRGEKVGK